EMIPLDILKELDAGFLQLISDHACHRSDPGNVEVAIEKLLAERSHGEPRDVAMLEQHAAIPSKRDGAVQLMGSIAQCQELLARGRPIRRLGKATATDRQGLIRA